MVGDVQIDALLFGAVRVDGKGRHAVIAVDIEHIQHRQQIRDVDIPVVILFEKEYIETALYLISTPNTGLFFVYCSIYCGFVGAFEPAHCGLSLICRLNLQ